MKKHKITWLDFWFGFLTASVLWLLIYAIISVSTKPTTISTSSVSKVDTSSTSSESTETVTETKVYDTSIKEFETGDIKWFTPDGFYSLTDDYTDSLKEYYGVSMPDMPGTFIVGNAESTYDSTILINAAVHSDVVAMLNKLYGDGGEEVSVSEVKTWIDTGEFPESLPDNYKVTEYPQIAGVGTNYRVFEVYYTTRYVSYEDDDTEQENPVYFDVPFKQLLVYSTDVDDYIEIVLYTTDWDINEVISYVEAFVGGTTVSDGTITIRYGEDVQEITEATDVVVDEENIEATEAEETESNE